MLLFSVWQHPSRIQSLLICSVVCMCLCARMNVCCVQCLGIWCGKFWGFLEYFSLGNNTDKRGGGGLFEAQVKNNLSKEAGPVSSLVISRDREYILSIQRYPLLPLMSAQAVLLFPHEIPFIRLRWPWMGTVFASGCGDYLLWQQIKRQAHPLFFWGCRGWAEAVQLGNRMKYASWSKSGVAPWNGLAGDSREAGGSTS